MDMERYQSLERRVRTRLESAYQTTTGDGNEPPNFSSRSGTAPSGNDTEYSIVEALDKTRAKGDFVPQAERLLNLLGYVSDRKLLNQSGDPYDFLEEGGEISYDATLTSNAKKIRIVFQVQDDEVKRSLQRSYIGVKRWDEGSGKAGSFIFFAVELKPDNYDDATLAEMVYSVNRTVRAPCVILFKYIEKLSVGVIGRRLNKRDDSKDVLLQVGLIRDIDLGKPSSAHIDKLKQLQLVKCQRWIRDNGRQHNFDELLKVWFQVADRHTDLNQEFVLKKYGSSYSNRQNKKPPTSYKQTDSIECLGLPSSHCEENLAHWNQYH